MFKRKSIHTNNNNNITNIKVNKKLKLNKNEIIMNDNNSNNNNTNSIIRPKSWPSDLTNIDLNVQDLPHNDASTEWWYINAHVEDNNGKKFSLFASFFKSVVGYNNEMDENINRHAITWALIDCDEQAYYPNTLLAHDAHEHIKAQINSNIYKMDPHIKSAYLEMLNKGNIPYPDKKVDNENEMIMLNDKLYLKYGDNIFEKIPNSNNYHCKCSGDNVSFDIVMKPKKKVCLQGDNGSVLLGTNQENMFYYFIPRNDIIGAIVIDNQQYKIIGQGWYDHEFGGTINKSNNNSNNGYTSNNSDNNSSNSDNSSEDDNIDSKSTNSKSIKNVARDYGWDWLSVQLSNGDDISISRVKDVDNDNKIIEEYAVYVDKSSNYQLIKDLTFQSLKKWISIKTAGNYDVEWLLNIPSINCHLNIKCVFEDQEMITVLGRPAFWEGRIIVNGEINGEKVTGNGFVELSGAASSPTFTSLLKVMGKETRHEIHKILPLDPTYNDLRNLVADSNMDHYMDGIDRDVILNNLIKPIRDIVDRGGKGWRSYALLLCLDSVGGNSNKHRSLLAMPELIHVGSLIVDDIQDESETRRGGLSVHHIYGEPLAINAGSAAYFFAMLAFQKANFSDYMQIKFYEHYFLTMRAAHTGQSLDIFGLDYMIDDVVINGENVALLKRVVCTHRLKSAIPASNLARIGILAGGGSEIQMKVMGEYFEAMGIAFQIIDDVLNLRGLPGKTKGEDIMAGKITYPVAKALSNQYLDRNQRRKLWNIVKSKPNDPMIVAEATNIIDGCGALGDSEIDALNMVEESWKHVDQHIPDSIYKLHLRAFGWYLLKRHY